jgi:outer membrane receptor for ferrienterochelin and colicins
LVPKSRRWFASLVIAALCAAAAGAEPTTGAPTTGPGDDEALSDLSLEELMGISVVSPSRTPERLADAPATVIVVTRRDIEERGYGDLSELLDDLPGMDVVRPRGATLFKNYWRGFRNHIGSPYLLLLDGTVLNHLYFNTDDVLVALPLAAVARVEVVYGPASAVYGPNAFAGVIHVITDEGEAARADGSPPAAEAATSPADDAAAATSQPAGTATWKLALEGGDNGRRGIDGVWRQPLGRWRLSLAARGLDNDLDEGSAAGYAFTDRGLLGDRRLWGGFLDDERLAGQLSSPERHRGADLRASGLGLEAAVQYFETTSGYGYEYAFDAAQPHAEWTRSDWSAWLRLRRDLGPLATTSLLRWRRSSVEDGSWFVEGFSETGPGGVQRRVVDHSLWRASNDSWALFEDLELPLRPNLVLLGGARWERKDLQKAYETAYGPSLPPAAVDVDTYPFADEGDVVGPPHNRVTTDDVGVYGEAKWRPLPHHGFHLGLRWDDNSAYGSTSTLRAGYAGGRGRWGWKALYGEGFQEPNPRVLYGGWRGSGSDPELDPERSRTWEASLTHTMAQTRHLLSAWRMENSDTIVSRAAGAENLGERTVSGLDYHFEALPTVPGLDSLRLWAYWSHLFTADEERFDAAGAPQPTGRIGDLAEDKLWLGVTASRGPASANLRARWVDARPTVSTNPVGEVGSFATADLYLRWRLRDFAASRRFGSPTLGLRVTNLLDEEYFHPGVREASAGADPGFFDEAGQWQGSAGFFNSLLPQPGRQVTLVVSFGS